MNSYWRLVLTAHISTSAAFSGAFEACERLITAGANINAIDTSFGDGRTALLKAASKGHDSIIDLLIRNGADTSIVDSAGNSFADFQILVKYAKNTLNGNIAQQQELQRIQYDYEVHVNCFTENTASDWFQSPALTCSICGEADLAFADVGGRLICQICNRKNNKIKPF